MKKCTRCKLIKSTKLFSKNKRSSDGLRSYCKECASKEGKKYYEENKEKISQYHKKHYHENKEKINKNSVSWRDNNREKTRKHCREYYYRNKDDINKRHRQWIKDNPDKNAQYYNKRRASLKGNGGVFTAEEWNKLKRDYGNICLCCKKKKKLEADHVIPVSKGGINNISNIQPLCKSCNTSKRDKIIDYRKEYK